MTRLGIATAFVVGMAGTCATGPVPSPYPVGSSPIVPPAHYRAIWKQAEACSGKHGDFDRVTWYVVPGQSFSSTTNTPAIGEWLKPHSILISQDWMGTDWVVRHEMVHDLTGLPHDGGARDIQIWGIQCQAMWGFLASDDPNYRP